MAFIGFFGTAAGQKKVVEALEPEMKTRRRNRDKNHHSHRACKMGGRNSPRDHSRRVHSGTANNQCNHTRHGILLFAPTLQFSINDLFNLPAPGIDIRSRLMAW